MSEAYLTTIKSVEDAVGKPAANIQVRERDIVCTFAGGRNADGSPSGNVEWRIKKW